MSNEQNGNVCHGGDSVELANALQQLQVEELMLNQNSHDSAQHSECTQYKMGSCNLSEPCGQGHHHRHIEYPSGSKWETHHIQRLRFECYHFNMQVLHRPQHRSGLCDDDQVEIISNWLFSSEEQMDRRMITNKSQFSVDEYAALLRIAFGRHDNIPTAVKSDLKGEIDIKGKKFLQLLQSLTDKYNIEDDKHEELSWAITKHVKDHCPAHITTLLTWIDICKHHARGELNSHMLDDLFMNVVFSAAHETNMGIRVRVRETTARRITVCGYNFSIESNIEVICLHGFVLVQIVTSTETKTLGSPQDTEQLLPQIASRAVACGVSSPFGDKCYKTVYQISVHVTKHPNQKNDEVNVFLVRCHISRNTLKNMSKCPVPNPLERSYLLHEKITFCGSIYDKDIIAFAYRAIKSVFVLFKVGFM
ncbi:uncharacterized protein [Ptychodera flava]|uniref:uncharacterized protein isoform X2 n=1 Tax=Ptychodera flava TaxID=63121 RepID=UPI00396A7413